MQISAGRHGLCCVIFRNNLTTIHKTGKIQSLGLHFDSFYRDRVPKTSFVKKFLLFGKLVSQPNFISKFIKFSSLN